MITRISVVLPLLLSGCFNFEPRIGEWALDYHLDRTRVLAIRVSPPALMPDDAVQIDALVLAPLGEPTPSTKIEVCGLQDDIRTEVWGPDCFENPQNIETIGTSLPAAYTPPDLSNVPCEQWDTGFFLDTDIEDTGYSWDQGVDGCTSSVPIMVSAQNQHTVGHAQIQAVHRLRGLREGEDLGVPVHDLSHDLIVLDDAIAGRDVRMEFRIGDPNKRGHFEWFVDGGALLRTGLTRVQRIEAEAVMTNNVLRIPADWQGPLRVVVVYVQRTSYSETTGPTWVNDYSVGDATWELTTLEVRP